MMQVYILEGDTLLRFLLEDYVICNRLQGVTVFEREPPCLSEDDPDEKADLLLSEPFFSTSLLPWHNLQFWFLRPNIRHLLHASAVIVPRAARFYGVAVEFDHLWKIRAPVRQAEGFDLSAFDRLIQHSQTVSDEAVEPQPLWEYPCIAATSRFHIATIDFTSEPSNKRCSRTGQVPFESSGSCNGIALWVDFVLDEENIVTTGPTETIVPGEYVTWDCYSRQGVYLFGGRSYNDIGTKELTWCFDIDPSCGSVSYKFEVTAAIA